MDISTFTPFAAVLNGLSALVVGLGDLMQPFAGASSSMLAIVLLTILVRLVLVPVSVSQVRAEVTRRRLAPAVAALRAKYAHKPEALQKALTRLYTSEKVSPIAGVLPTLAQAPVLSAVYALFVHPQLAGHTNALLGQTFLGIPLGSNLFAALGATFPYGLAFVALLVLLAVVVELTRRANARWAGVPAVHFTGQPQSAPGMAILARILPFVTVVFAAIAPLAAALYLVTSAAFTLGERAALRRVIRTPRAA
ncbi:YidC/Oxa1 family membrane protein insertase [Subtercola boreus]|uniref:Membrane protein insertase YidC n=1 Tax=Subtercola boreus TaxID=120213 RepID=A0A3E0WEM7_9MICO|nr:membrane protein insertase YidC [Subtercola boreus]RFA22809.1 preprotein translocase [Subtercola boreus]RFA23164.1 preprotein translocase [Subtercola boreus]RFA28917.1 preprotein translocase [Subtercola boreus]